MEKNQRIFLYILSLFVLGDFIAVSITNLYIWEQTKNFQNILIFNFFVFISMAVSGLIASMTAPILSNKVLYLYALVFYVLQLVLLILLQNNAINYLILIGSISGIGIGIGSYSYNVISLIITNGENRNKLLGIKTSLLSLIILIGVPFLTYLKTITNSYTSLFLFGIILLLFTIYFITKLNIVEQKKRISLKEIYVILSQVSDFKIYLLCKYLFGIENGLFWVVLGIVTFQFVGDLFTWGIFTSFLTLLSILAAFIYGKTITLHSGKYTSVFATFLFGFSTLILATNWSYPSFIFYQIVLVILNVVMAVSFEGYMAAILEEEKLIQFHNELNGLGEFILNLGRLTPIIFLLIFAFTLDNTTFLRILFVIVSSLPIFIINALNRTTPFKTE